MMKNLRARTNHFALKIILAFVALAFILTGIGTPSFIENINEYAAKVNGQKISQQQLEQLVQREYNYQKTSMKKQFSNLATDEIYIHHIRQKVLSQLINTTLLDQYAEKLGLNINDDQIKQEIFSIPAFHTENTFDNNKFRSLLANMGLLPDQYVSMVRKQLLAQQLFQAIDSTGFLLPAETNRLISIATQIREVRLATFDINALAEEQTTSNIEIEESYNTNKNHYLFPETFKVNYILIDATQLELKTSVDEKEIQAWYDHNPHQFATPIRKRYSIIQSKTKDDAHTLLKKLQQGGNFSILAKKHSIDILSAKNGGDIGWMSDDSIMDELKQAKLEEKGQISEVIESPFGFLIACLDDIKPAIRLGDKEVAKKLKKEKAINAYYALHKKLIDATRNNNTTLKETEVLLGIKAQQTDWFSQENVPTELNFDSVKQILFNGSLLDNNDKPGSNLDVVQVEGNRAFVIQVANHKPESIKSMASVRKDIQENIKRQKALKQARVNAENLLAALKENKGDEKMQALGLKFSKPQSLYAIQDDNALVQTVFSLPPPNKVSYGITEDIKGNIVLVALDKITLPPLNKQQRRIFINQLNHSMTDLTFDALLTCLRREANITVNSTT